MSDYVGRCLAEAYHSDYTSYVTMTYAPGADRDIDLAHKMITKEHAQKFFRSLRDRHHKIRYFCVGEYGDLEGRSHFHALIFGSLADGAKKWEMPHCERSWHDAWPHGHLWCENNITEKSIRYVCKYILKNERGKYHMTLSKKPTLGNRWFKQKAQNAIDLGVLINSFEYMPPGGNRKRSYLMTGATRREYLREIVEGWKERRAFNRDQLNEWVVLALEKMDRHDMRKICEAYDPLENDWEPQRMSNIKMRKHLNSVLMQHNLLAEREEKGWREIKEVGQGVLGHGTRHKLAQSVLQNKLYAPSLQEPHGQKLVSQRLLDAERLTSQELQECSRRLLRWRDLSKQKRIKQNRELLRELSIIQKKGASVDPATQEETANHGNSSRGNNVRKERKHDYNHG